MMPALTEHPQQEPMLERLYQWKRLPFHGGHRSSCIVTDGSHLPLSQHTLGFSGTKQIIPMTEPVPMKI